MGTRSYAEGRDICNIHPHSAEEVMALADIQLRGYSYASPAVIKKQRRSRMSSYSGNDDEPPRPQPKSDEPPKRFADYLAQVRALPKGVNAADTLEPSFNLRQHMRCNMDHELYYNDTKNLWGECTSLDEPLTTSTRLRRYWDEEVPQPRDETESKPEVTNPPPKAMNIFSAFSLVHYARKWRKMSKRRFKITRDMYGDSGNKAGGGPTLVPTITKAPEVKAMLWTAIQANDMLRSMDESTVLRMLMAMARVDFAAGATVMNQGDSTHLFVVASGLVEGSCRQLLSKVDKALGLFKAGQVMGEVTMIGGAPKSSMKLKAKTDCSLYALDRPVFVAIMKHETMMKNRLAFMRSVCLDGMPPLFDELADSEMMTWMLQFREQTVEPGYKFTSQGEMGTDWYLVFAGRVDVIVDDVLVKTLGKFAWFGEGAALSGNKLRNASCVAASKVTVLQLGSTACAKLFPRLPFTTVYHNRCIKTVLSELPIPLMANLQEEDVAAINPLFQYLSFKRGDTVVSQGAPAQHFYVMTKGEATVLQLGPLPFASPYASPSASPMRLPPGGSSHSMNGMMQNMFSNMGGQVCAPERSPRTSGVSGVSSTPSSPSRLVSTHTEWQHQFGMMHGGSMMMPNMQPPGQGMYGVGNWQYSAEGMYGPPASPMGSSFGSLPSLQAPAPPTVLATLQCGAKGQFGFKNMVLRQPYGATVVVKSEQLDCLVLHASLWEPLIERVHRLHWVDQLTSWPLFATLNKSQLLSLNANLQQAHFPKGSVIVPAGRLDMRLFLVVAGEAVAVETNQHGSSKVVMSMGKGAFFGEEGMLSAAPYTHSVVASTDVSCFYLDNRYIEAHMGNLEALLWEHLAWKKMGNPNIDNPIEMRLTDRTLNLTSLNIHRVLGKGQFGKVVLVSSKETGRKYALKVLNKSDIVSQGQVEHVRDEKDVLDRLDHPFCNKLVCTFHDRTNVYMLISLCQGGDLLAAQEKWNNSQMSESTAQFYIACIILALEYLHSLNIAYRDMKQENMMIDAQGYLKIVDYGLSKVLSAGVRAFTVCGTAQFIAPEVITCKGHGSEVDMWSLGVLAYELLVGESPFVSESDMEPEEIFKSIVRGNYKIPELMSPAAADLIMNLLRREPVARLGCGPDGFQRLKSHAFFATLDWHRLLRRQIAPPFVPHISPGDTTPITTLDRLLNWSDDDDDDEPIEAEVLALLDSHF